MPGVLLLTSCSKPNPIGPSFHADVAPVMHQHCIRCHQPGGDAPFSLISYEDANIRRAEIIDVLKTGHMPLWLPADDSLPILGRPTITEAEKDLLTRWADSGLEGQINAPATPPKNVHWSLGEPDLHVVFPTVAITGETNTLYHTVIASAAVDKPRYVTGIQIHSGNNQAIQQMTLQIDPYSARRGQGNDNHAVCFSGPAYGLAQHPDGHVLNWTPGKQGQHISPELAWTLKPGTDLVLQLHLRDLSEAASLTPEVGLYFSDDPPIHQTHGVTLECTDFEIPAGQSAFALHQSFTLPADSHLYTLYPQAHLLCRSMMISADLPSGESVRLLHIPHWNPNGQDAYQLASPYYLPKGSILQMDYVYDNSSDNPSNPYSPPQPIIQGYHRTDEIARLSAQLLPVREADYPALQEASIRNALAKNDSANNHLELANLLRNRRAFEEALTHYQQAIQRTPKSISAHRNLAATYASSGQLANAYEAMVETIELNPANAEAWAYMGSLLIALEDQKGATEAFQQVLELDPDNRKALAELNRLKKLAEH